ncbi:Gfo/Idh/MocA family oxidoreductase [Arthrobacter sp. ISL-30]|uniref:Gfo/Idh/MocA family protein n=1 Tax=Arthrobacter sp. ISL-30 TaxID=2819109 RepID=UPI001BEC0EC5|nr:Gfo/Idh/MocA family oxidoreductase [Arthrobacter sp. ISL-30]MBT2512375.1 Gfo/Idh/MocA family oxidoreductase [Arthrobacter sp. ISL-30]
MDSKKTHPIRTAILGFGISGRVFHAPLIAADASYSLDAIVTSQPERAGIARATYPDSLVIPSPGELFGRIDSGELALDLVILGTPPATHKELALEAFRRKLAVVVDKPFVPSSSEAEELIEAAVEEGVTLTVFQNRRWDADFLTLRRLIASGELGDIRSFESRFEWWMPEGFGNWRDRASLEEGGGILHDLGAHLIDQALELFGPVVDVYGETSRFENAQSDADQAAFVSLFHESGVRSRLWMNGHAAQPGPRFHVLGSKAGYTKWGLDGQEPALAAGVLPTDSAYGIEASDTWGRLGTTGSTRHVLAERGSYPQFYTQLAHALQTGSRPPVDPRDSVEVLRVIERARSTSFEPA